MAGLDGGRLGIKIDALIAVHDAGRAVGPDEGGPGGRRVDADDLHRLGDHGTQGGGSENTGQGGGSDSGTTGGGSDATGGNEHITL